MSPPNSFMGLLGSVRDKGQPLIYNRLCKCKGMRFKKSLELQLISNNLMPKNDKSPDKAKSKYPPKLPEQGSDIVALPSNLSYLLDIRPNSSPYRSPSLLVRLFIHWSTITRPRFWPPYWTPIMVLISY